MPRKKQIVQKQKRQKSYAPGEMAGDNAHVKPKGPFKIFSNYQLFAVIGVVAIGGGLLLAVMLGGGTSATSGDDNGVRGEGVKRTTPLAGATAEGTSSTGAADTIKEYSAPPAMSIDTSKTYTATLKTEQGDIAVELDAKGAPSAVNNFVFLAKDGYYDGSTFFRVVADDSGTLHIAQAGDPTGTGLGGPGYELPFEETSTSFTLGTLGMAKPDGAGRANNGSQFFFTLTDQPSFADKNTAFGQIVSGVEVLQALTPRDPNLTEDSEPGLRIQTIEITES